MKKRAKLLTDSDLVAVMMLRVAERKDVKPFAAGKVPDSQETTQSGVVDKVLAVDDPATPAVTPEEVLEEAEK